MREIKFRAWNGKKMFEVDVISFQTDTCWNGYDFYSGDSGERCEFGNNEKGFLMQYTGLKDKNGKEIYEKDIISWKNAKERVWANQREANQIVEFPFICGNADLGEIIGNIYENPELLK